MFEINIFEIITVDELIKRLGKYNHKELHIHHTWRPNHVIYNARPDPIYWQEAMDNFHENTNGWSDIAQHVTLLPDGLFVTGRGFGINPASITGYNSGAFAVEMIGDFDTGNDILEGKQRASIIGLARWFDSRGKYVRFHRENSTKTCPGSGIDKTVFMAEVKGQATIKEVDDVFKKGDKGTPVKALQNVLVKIGFTPGKVDGIFGVLTEGAVKKFQSGAGCQPTGVVDSVTMGAILNRLMVTNSIDAAMTAQNGALKQENTELRKFVTAVDTARKGV